jgi:hypothetical protein
MLPIFLVFRGKQHNTIQKTEKKGSMNPTKNNKGEHSTTQYRKLKR